MYYCFRFVPGAVLPGGGEKKVPTGPSPEDVAAIKVRLCSVKKYHDNVIFYVTKKYKSDLSSICTSETEISLAFKGI